MARAHEAPVPILSHYRISPSDLVYLWEDCKRCFYDKYVHGFERPRSFSEHFTNTDRAMRRALPPGEKFDLGVGQAFRVLRSGRLGRVEVDSLPLARREPVLSRSVRRGDRKR